MIIYGIKVTDLVLASAAMNSSTSGGSSSFEPFIFFATAMLMLIVLCLALYLIYRMRKRAQERIQEMRSTLHVGDKVITIEGVNGIIKRITEDNVVLETDEGIGVTLSKSAIVRNLTFRKTADAP